MEFDQADVIHNLEEEIDNLAEKIFEAKDLNPGNFVGINVRLELKKNIQSAVIETMGSVIANGDFVDLDDEELN